MNFGENNTPPVKKIESFKGFGNRWEGLTVQIFKQKIKGVGGNGRILRKKYKRIRKSVTF